jgi:hypothetical protein
MGANNVTRNSWLTHDNVGAIKHIQEIYGNKSRPISPSPPRLASTGTPVEISTSPGAGAAFTIIIAEAVAIDKRIDEARVFIFK